MAEIDGCENTLPKYRGGGVQNSMMLLFCLPCRWVLVIW